ncbi:RDD family protein [Lentibacillus halodurans]|uniref:RDD family protein n=1 Tax=Lentibacillus halodurans TaxID=237679 RepID=A0A1I0ZXE3_9BACI|nr:RDD family protein [Lentibacillus halodurans]
MPPINDGHVTFKAMFMREVIGFYFIGILTIGLAFIVTIIMIAVREDKRGLHDLIGGTHVIKVE